LVNTVIFNMAEVNKKEQVWTSSEIREILVHVAELQQTNEDLRAGIIMMQAALDRETAKVTRYKNVLKAFGVGEV